MVGGCRAARGLRGRGRGLLVALTVLLSVRRALAVRGRGRRGGLLFLLGRFRCGGPAVRDLRSQRCLLVLTGRDGGRSGAAARMPRVAVVDRASLVCGRRRLLRSLDRLTVL